MSSSVSLVLCDGSTGVTLEWSMVDEIGRETIGTEVLDGHPTALFQITVQEGQPIESCCESN